MSLTNNKLELLLKDLNSEGTEEIKRLFNINADKNSFYSDVTINENSIMKYPENVDELINQLVEIGKINYNKLDKRFIDNLKEFISSIKNEEFDEDIPLFTYTL